MSVSNAEILKPLGFDPSREAIALSQSDLQYLLATPRQEPADAGVIAHISGDHGGGTRFAGFARRQAWLFQALDNRYGTAFVYRLSVDGAAVADAAKTLAASAQGPSA